MQYYPEPTDPIITSALILNQWAEERAVRPAVPSILVRANERMKVRTKSQPAASCQSQVSQSVSS